MVKRVKLIIVAATVCFVTIFGHGYAQAQIQPAQFQTLQPMQLNSIQRIVPMEQLLEEIEIDKSQIVTEKPETALIRSTIVYRKDGSYNPHGAFREVFLIDQNDGSMESVYSAPYTASRHQSPDEDNFLLQRGFTTSVNGRLVLPVVDLRNVTWRLPSGRVVQFGPISWSADHEVLGDGNDNSLQASMSFAEFMRQYPSNVAQRGSRACNRLFAFSSQYYPVVQQAMDAGNVRMEVIHLTWEEAQALAFPLQ